MSTKAEVWLRGPIDNIPALLQPVAHALLQAREEVNALTDGFPDDLLWEKPAGLASPGFHLQHLTGVLDRLFTYARGDQLDLQQLGALSSEGKQGDVAIDPALLVEKFNARVDDALLQLSKVDEKTLTNPCEVGRAKLSSTVIGLYVHAAEHTMRHVGQLLVTIKILEAKYK